MKKEPLLLKSWFIAVLFACWFLYGVPLIVGIILLFIRSLWIKKAIADIENTQQEYKSLQARFASIGAERYEDVTLKVAECEQHIEELNASCKKKELELNQVSEKVSNLVSDAEKLERQLQTNRRNLSRMKELYDATQYSVSEFHKAEVTAADLLKGKIDSIMLTKGNVHDIETLAPTAVLHLHSMDIKDLKAEMTSNDKNIQSVLEVYAGKYNTKANKSIYGLMTIALRSELQNILYAMKYEKLDVAENNIRSITDKYLKIVGDGNQSIAGTLQKFIKELEFLFLNAVKIEYAYYVRKEQQKEEQARIREQMKQEVEERRQLEAERKKVEQEEQKYKAEIENIQETIMNGSGDEAALKKRMSELIDMLDTLNDKKEEIVTLQNGKAGYVYVISNLGSFGDNMFKVGMTRRLNPMERVDELGDASVPFRFDVHALIFSEDASTLETKLHRILDDKRVNKVNLRKEFFYSNVDELRELVQKIEPSAEFTTTMAAIEYRQSQSFESNS